MPPKRCCCGEPTLCNACPENSSATSYTISFGTVACSPFNGGDIVITTSGTCTGSVTSGVPETNGYTVTLNLSPVAALVHWTVTVNINKLMGFGSFNANAVYEGDSDFCQDETELPITLNRTSFVSGFSCPMPTTITISAMTI